MSKEKELILEAKHVTKKFPLTKGKELIANDDVSLKFYKGQTLGIVGESGCGTANFRRNPFQGKRYYKDERGRTSEKQKKCTDGLPESVYFL